jgi:integrase
MASAYFDKIHAQWIVSYRGPHQVLKQRTRRRVRGSGDWSKAQADAYAAECDRYSRLVEGLPTRGDLDHAEHIGVIAPAQAETLRTGLLLPPPGPGERDPFKPWTILEAAEVHPSTQHDRTRAPTEYRKHRRYLQRFIIWSGLERLDQLSLEAVTRWVSHMRAQGWAWDTRRQHLLYLRRACRMAASVAGLPDILGELTLDRREQSSHVEAWTLDQVLTVARQLAARDPDAITRRGLAVLALGAGLGLRPTEMIRLRVEHLAGDVLRVGVVSRKNAASRRDLPIPARLLPWIETMTRDPETGEGRPAGAALLPGRNHGKPLTAHALDAWWAKEIAPKFDSPGPLKNLRKTFATAAIELGVDPHLVESYLGHVSGLVAAVTSRHYLAAARVAQLRPLAARLDEACAKRLKKSPVDLCNAQVYSAAITREHRR